MREPAKQSTRTKILIAAATLLGEDPTSRLSVRTVAARAGVSVGSLRHFFPTQQALIDTVIAGIYDLYSPLRDHHGDPAGRTDKHSYALRTRFLPPALDDLLDLRTIRGADDVVLPVPTAPVAGVVDTELAGLW